eukprot:TRINITY_DN464_c0_g1_i4.p1 TRINITY_DN464_c0_g1~~TRINITY_DN464_c0_g1_i4.p1  ORF type:complete len:174 (-),score=77.55 TRINITY_DN464_c0_g1_i4:237-758(-)
MKKLEEVKEKYANLATLFPPEEFFRYRDQWKQVNQTLVFQVALIHYVQNKTLVTEEEVQEVVGGFRVELDEFLLGLTQLPKELSRYCVNKVTVGDFDTPREVGEFVNDLYSGFRLLNLKNDGLRKKFDGIKYDVKKIEEVLYDISIRGLNSSNGEGEAKDASSSSKDAMEEEK